MVLTSPNALLYSVNMANRDRHPKKEVEEALQDADAAEWTCERRGGGHAWAVIRCKFGCCQLSVSSTPKNTGNEASRIRRKVKRCPKGKR